MPSSIQDTIKDLASSLNDIKVSKGYKEDSPIPWKRLLAAIGISMAIVILIIVAAVSVIHDMDIPELSDDELGDMMRMMDGRSWHCDSDSRKALREAAETENYKKRLRADKDSAVRYANEGLIKDLLDPLDNFSRAVEAAGTSSDIESIRTGVSMVENQLQSILHNSWGLEPYSPEGEDFNPAEMEACLMQEDENLDREKVLQVLLKGYKLNGKVIRAAKVMVGKPKKN